MCHFVCYIMWFHKIIGYKTPCEGLGRGLGEAVSMASSRSIIVLSAFIWSSLFISETPWLTTELSDTDLRFNAI